MQSPHIPILSSPHSYYDRQNLYNFDLVVFPMQRISFRIDYNRNRISRTVFQQHSSGNRVAATMRTGTTSLNGFRFGADFRVNKKTTISYTQLLQYYDGGQTYSLNTYQLLAAFQSAHRSAFGLPWFNSGSPVQCAAEERNRQSSLATAISITSLYQHDQYKHPYRATQLGLRH